MTNCVVFYRYVTKFIFAQLNFMVDLRGKKNTSGFSNFETHLSRSGGKTRPAAVLPGKGSPCVKQKMVIYGKHSQIAFVAELIYWHVLYVNLRLRRIVPQKCLASVIYYYY